MNICLLNQFY